MLFPDEKIIYEIPIYSMSEKEFNRRKDKQKAKHMHDKFCIIDMDYVMHGSYNWTPTANNNEETLATALDHELVSKFADEFMQLYNEA